MSLKAGKRLAILALTRGGRELGEKIVQNISGAELLTIESSVAETLAATWLVYDRFICIMATGIVVRAVAPLLADKAQDPCVVVADEQGRFAISLLGGHLGGGNELAAQVAAITNGQSVLTTASDTLGLTAIDLWCRVQGLVPSSRSALTMAAAYLVNNGSISVFSAVEGFLPSDFIRVTDAAEARIIISEKIGWPEERLVLCPPVLVVGVGCNRGTACREFEQALAELLAENNLARQSVIGLASIDLKRDEQGLIDFAAQNTWPIDFYTKEELNSVSGVSRSVAVLKTTGAQGVAEPAALLAARSDQLIIRKKKWQNVTLAVALVPYTLSAAAPAD